MNSENLIRLNNYETEQIRETYTEGEFILADYYPPVMRIVRSEAKALIRSKTVMNDKLTVEGSVEFTVMYLSDDGTLTPCTHMLPFTHTCETKITKDDICEISATVSYINTRALSPQKLYLKATVELQTSHTRITEFSAVIPDSEENVYTRKAELDSFEVICSGHKPLKITDEIKPAARIRSVLRYDVFFNETEQKILTEKLISKADMLLKIVYLTYDGDISAYEQKVAVSQILDMNGLTEDTICGVKYTLTDCRMTVANSGEEANNSIIYEITVDVDAAGFAKNKHILCCDAFSDKKELKCTTHMFKSGGFSKISKEQSFRETLDIGLYDKIFDISVLPAVLSTDYDRTTGILSVSGTFSCRALFRDENSEFSSTEKELPFMLSLQTDCSAENIKVSAEMYVNSFAYVENNSSSAELRIDCTYKGFLFCSDNVEILTEINSDGEIFDCVTDRMTLYFAEKDENIWDISKKYRKDPELLMKTNGLTTDILDEAVMLRI